MFFSKEKGFTLIELMVVIAIIAVLAAVITPQVFRQIQKGRVSAAAAFSDAVKTSANNYFTDRSVWPGSCTPANCNTIANGFVTGGAANWDGPYLDRWPTATGNPWGGTYTWMSATTANFGVAALPERYITIGAVPTADAQRLDLARDGALGSNTGIVRAAFNPAAWPAAPNVVVWILISRDGPVS